MNLVRVFDLVGYSYRRRVLGGWYFMVSRIAARRGYTEAAAWYALASTVNYLHLPYVGQWASDAAMQWIPLEDWAGFWSAVRKG